MVDRSRLMQFAAFALAGSSAREDPEVIFRRIVEYAIEAEELGYDAVWFAASRWIRPKEGFRTSSGDGPSKSSTFGFFSI